MLGKCKSCGCHVVDHVVKMYHGVTLTCDMCFNCPPDIECDIPETLTKGELENALHAIAGIPGPERRFMNAKVIPAIEQAIRKKATDMKTSTANVDAAKGKPDDGRTELKYRAFLGMTTQLATLGTCARRKVGCMIVDSKFRVLATGYNGMPAGMDHCTDSPCAAATMPSGTGLDQCRAIHAEQNALISLTDPDRAHIVFCTTAPCLHCVKMLAATLASVIVFGEDYPHSEQSRQYWEGLGRKWLYLPKTSV